MGQDGLTESSLATGPSFGCLDRSMSLPDSLSPASKYRGAVVLDSANSSGTLIFRPNFTDDDGGWEWAYGA